MKLTRICLVFNLFVLLQACGPNQKDLNQEKRAEVMAIHDEVMPKLGQLKSFEKKAIKKIEEISNRTPMDSSQVEELKVLVIELNQAYEGMFDWMHQYETDDNEETPEAISVYLDGQLVSVSEVNKSIKDVIAKSDSILAD